MASDPSKQIHQGVRGKRILVMDPNPLLCDFYCHILTAQGYVAVPATRRDEALALLADEFLQFSLCVLDVAYPEGEGWAFLQELRKDPNQHAMPVIAVTDFSDSIRVYNEIKQFCDAMVLKGEFEIPQFNELVNWMLKRRVREGQSREAQLTRTRII